MAYPVSTNAYGATIPGHYKFGFNSDDAPSIAGVVIRSAEIKWEPPVVAPGFNQYGSVIALATTAPARRKITGTFNGYVKSDFNANLVTSTFTFLTRTYTITHIGDAMRKGEFNEIAIDAESHFSLGALSTSFGDLEYYGATGFIENLGTLNTDIYGLTTADITWKYSQNSAINLFPSLFDVHPTYTWLHLERQKVEYIPGFAMVTSGYAGVSGNPEPVYELCLGLGEEPIETHPKFVSDIAGTPASPLNGAIFIDFETGKKTTDNNRGVFDRFQNMIGSGRNQFAGISAFLDLSQITWRKRFVTNTRPSDSSQVGYINNPEGPAPSVVNNAYWVYAGESYEQRGLSYFVTREWRCAGRQAALQSGAAGIIYTP
jgi:hypothetical protein